jgi:hypothetical protein
MVTNVTNMGSCFIKILYLKFDSIINNWNTSKVTNIDIHFGAISFNQPLYNWNVLVTLATNILWRIKHLMIIQHKTMIIY